MNRSTPPRRGPPSTPSTPRLAIATATHDCVTHHAQEPTPAARPHTARAGDIENKRPASRWLAVHASLIEMPAEDGPQTVLREDAVASAWSRCSYRWFRPGSGFIGKFERTAVGPILESEVVRSLRGP